MAQPEYIKRLPADERVKALNDLAAHFWEMAMLAHNDGAKLLFNDMAREMLELADAEVTFFR